MTDTATAFTAGVSGGGAAGTYERCFAPAACATRHAPWWPPLDGRTEDARVA